MSGMINGIRKAKRIAVKENAEVIQSRYSRLLLDLDDFKDLVYYNQSLPYVTELLAERGYILKKKDSWKSKSGVGEHVYLMFPKQNKKYFDFPTRLLLEVCLGSDRKRALFSLMNYLDGEPESNLLFKPKK